MPGVSPHQTLERRDRVGCSQLGLVPLCLVKVRYVYLGNFRDSYLVQDLEDLAEGVSLQEEIEVETVELPVGRSPPWWDTMEAVVGACGVLDSTT